MLEENLDMCNTLKKYFEGNIIWFFLSKKKNRFCVNVDRCYLRRELSICIAALKKHIFTAIFFFFFFFFFCKLRSVTQQTMTEHFWKLVDYKHEITINIL